MEHALPERLIVLVTNHLDVKAPAISP